jgi:hypothetical protein
MLLQTKLKYFTGEPSDNRETKMLVRIGLYKRACLKEVQLKRGSILPKGVTLRERMCGTTHRTGLPDLARILSKMRVSRIASDSSNEIIS